MLGDTCFFFPVSFEFCYWVVVELIFLQSMKFTPGPVQYSSFLLPWHLLPSAPLTLLAPHLCSAGHHSMAPGDSEMTGIEPGALLHGRIRGLCPLCLCPMGQGRKDGEKSSNCLMGAETLLAGLAGQDGSDAGPRGLRLALSLPSRPGRVSGAGLPTAPTGAPEGRTCLGLRGTARSGGAGRGPTGRGCAWSRPLTPHRKRARRGRRYRWRQCCYGVPGPGRALLLVRLPAPG